MVQVITLAGVQGTFLMPYSVAYHPSLELVTEARNSSMHLLSLATGQQPRGELGDAAFPGKQSVGSERQKHLVQAELAVPNLE